MKNKKPDRKALIEAASDNLKAATAASLKYVSCEGEGIRRLKKGKGFQYVYKGRVVKDPEELQRIRKLAIPPSWKDVWICPAGNGHIQATGTDLKGRKQYRYHANWAALRNETKFHRLLEFGKVLPRIRRKVKKDLRSAGLNEAKVLASAVTLLEQTHIRVGNGGYEKLYGSYGLTTLKDNHVNIQKDKIVFSFRGKKGILHKLSIRDRRLARIVKQCRDIPGKELFQYYGDDGEIRSIDSGMLNDYIRQAAKAEFSAKDFRTWAGSLLAMECLLRLEKEKDKGQIVRVLDFVSSALGNTRNICKKYYVHPLLLTLYENGRFFKCIRTCNPQGITASGLNQNEKTLLRLLGKYS